MAFGNSIGSGFDRGIFIFTSTSLLLMQDSSLYYINIIYRHQKKIKEATSYYLGDVNL